MILVSELQYKQALKRRLKNQDFNGIRNAPYLRVVYSLWQNLKLSQEIEKGNF